MSISQHPHNSILQGRIPVEGPKSSARNAPIADSLALRFNCGQPGCWRYKIRIDPLVLMDAGSALRYRCFAKPHTEFPSSNLVTP